MKLSIKGYGANAEVKVNDIDLSKVLTGIKINMKGHEIPIAILEMPVNELELEGDYKILKDVQEIVTRGNAVDGRDIPKVPVGKTYYGRDMTTYAKCPTCDAVVTHGYPTNEECPKCGQKLEW